MKETPGKNIIFYSLGKTKGAQIKLSLFYIVFN